MAGGVKASYRQEQAAATRQRIAAAARRLFAAHGYRPTTMDAIAAEAGVAPRTVYTTFGAKREILSEICERWLFESGAVGIVNEALLEPDPAKRLRLAAHFLRALYSSGFDVVQLFEAAMDDDAETRALLRAKLAGRNQAQNTVIASLEGQLAMPVPAAQAVYRALAAPGIYQELVIESGWTVDQYEDWIADALRRQLLPGAGARVDA
jgi:AcrR family transcriptional regulator